MKEAKLDVSVWNLGVPLALLTACGPIVLTDENDTDGTTDTVGTQTNTTTIGTTVGTVDPDECRVDDDCPDWRYSCQNGQCIYDYEYPCGEYGCCEGECGWYPECYVDEECGPGWICEYNYCVSVPGPQLCDDLALVPAIPLVEGDEPIVTLAFVEALPSAGRELAMATASGISVVASDGSGSSVDVPDVLELAAADVDLDGDEDLVAIIAGAVPTVRTLLADGMGGFVDGPSLELAATQLVLGDLDLDGVVDLVTGSATGVELRHGQGDGSFVSPLALDGDDPTVAIAAVPAQPGSDLLFYSGDYLWLANAAAGLSASDLDPPVVFTVPGNLTVGDYDGNGWPDASVIDIGTGTSVIQTWHDLATFDGALPWAPETSYSLAASGDLDGDGRDELALLAGNGELAVRMGQDPLGSLGPLGCYVIGVTAEFGHRLLVDDFDGDGRGDVIAAAGATLAWTRLQ